MKNTFVGFVSTVATAIALSGCGDMRKDAPKGNFLDARVDPASFAIFPWDELACDKGKYDELYDCGFNLAGFAKPASLKTLREARLKCFVTDPLIKVADGGGLSDEEVVSRVRKVVASTRSDPAVFGYRIVDEPPRSTFKQVARWVKAFESQAPNKIPLVNLFPDYSQSKAGLTNDAYHTYVGAFIDQVDPRVLSFDDYALFYNGKLRDSYFPNLETFREMSLKTGLPFYHVILGNSHFEYAEPSPQWFRFQVYTSLAYGVHGIAWFTYVDRERGNYRNAAIDLYGRRSPTWKMIRDVNLVCHRLAPVLTRMKSVGVFHYPDPPDGCRGLADSKFLQDVRGNGPFVVGEFENGNSRAVLVVNKSLTKSTHFAIVPKPAGAGRKTILQKVSSITGEILPMSAENDWLAPGQGILLLLSDAAAKTQ